MWRPVVEVIDDVGDVGDLLLTAARSVSGALPGLARLGVAYVSLRLLCLRWIIGSVNKQLG